MDNMALSEFAAARRAAARLLLTSVYSRHLFFLGGGDSHPQKLIISPQTAAKLCSKSFFGGDN